MVTADSLDVWLRIALQSAAGCVLLFFVMCRFYRMRGDATLVAIALHLMLLRGAWYNITEPFEHVPDPWGALAIPVALAVLMIHTRGRWYQGLPEEFSISAQSKRAEKPAGATS